ncbi:MAG TPA: hypothetical protein VMU94_09145 [Streptosporangiaceae bacterium]|nr:hypothetical protein [Streptosporangiaceae bacterium]
MTAAHETLAKIDAELAQHVTWDGRSADAASSAAADLDDDWNGACAVCGHEPGDGDGLSHDSWSAEHTSCQPHDYEPAPEPYATGEHLIARADLYEVNGYLTWPAADDRDAGVHGWGLAEVWQRDGDCGWWPQWLEEGLTLDEAVEVARLRNIKVGALLGSIW